MLVFVLWWCFNDLLIDWFIFEYKKILREEIFFYIVLLVYGVFSFDCWCGVIKYFCECMGGIEGSCGFLFLSFI